jgi:tripartite-type tricarboxylate transporter receptor subunit TctC
VAGPRRSALLPEVPTLKEAGVDGVDVQQWYGLFAPAKTPRAVIDKLNKALNAALADAGVRERLLAQGSEAVGGTPEALGKVVADELPKWAKLVRDANIKSD